MFEAIPKGRFNRDFEFSGTSLRSAELGKINDYWLEKYYLLIDDRRYDLSRETYFSNKFLISEDGSLVASARKRGFFSNSFDMTFDRVSYSLCKNTGLKTHFELFKDNKPPAIGTIVQKQLFSANLIIDLPDSLSTKLQFFIAWLAIVLIHRSQNTND